MLQSDWLSYSPFIPCQIERNVNSTGDGPFVLIFNKNTSLSFFQVLNDF